MSCPKCKGEVEGWMCAICGSESSEHDQNNLRTIQDKLNKLVDMRADGELSREEFMAQKEKILKEMASVEALISDTQLSARNWFNLTEEFLDNAFNAKEIITDGLPEEKRKLINSIGENLLLRDKKLEFSFKKPYDVLLLPEYRTNVLRD